MILNYLKPEDCKAISDILYDWVEEVYGPSRYLLDARNCDTAQMLLKLAEDFKNRNVDLVALSISEVTAILTIHLNSLVCEKPKNEQKINKYIEWMRALDDAIQDTRTEETC